MAADRVWSCEVAHACVIGGGQLEDGLSEVGDVNGAPDVIGEQHRIASPGGQIVDECLVHGATVADDQRGASDDGGRGDQADRRFGADFAALYGVTGSGVADSSQRTSAPEKTAPLDTCTSRDPC